ncbi:MAG TPA: hypothetical protein VMR43_08020 [Variovorax sp.]|nr:hypothetical protein [Variovorax sp.]
MMGDHHRFARLSDTDLSDIARAMRSQAQGSTSSTMIANALETIVQRRCEVLEDRQRRNPARAGLRALQRLTCWVSTGASMRINAASGRSRP